MDPLILDKPFQQGLRAKAQASKAGVLLVDCLNAVPTPDGAVPALTGWDALPTALTTEIFTTLGATRAFPSPQILRGRAVTILALPTALYTLNETTWASTPLRPISSTPTNEVTNGTFTEDAAGWTLGIDWTWTYDPASEPAFKGHVKQNNGTSTVTQAGAVTSGLTYYVSFQARSDTPGATATIRLGTAALTFSLSAQPRAYSGYITANGVDAQFYASIGADAAVTGVEIYPVESIPTGGLWQMADFGPVYVLVNGACTVFVCNYSQGGFTQSRCFVDTTINPNTVTNNRGRLQMGGFQGTDTWKAAWDTFWGTIGTDTGTTGVPTDNLSSRHLWWSSIGGEDMLQYFLPETLLERPGTTYLDQAQSLVFNGTFRRKDNGWVLSSGFSAADGYLEHTAGTADTAEQASERMALLPVLGDNYDIHLEISNRTAGSVTVYLGTTAALVASGNGYHTAQGTFTDNLNLQLAASSDFDGRVVDVRIRPTADTSWAEDIWLLGEQGHRALPWQGSLLAQHQLGGVSLIGTTDGVAAMSPTGSTLGLTVVHNIGLAGRGALAGSLREALFVDRAGTIWRIGSDLSLTREGREEFLGPLLSGQGPVIHYNSDRDEYVIAVAGNRSFVVTRTGVGQIATSIFALPQLEGTFCYLGDAALAYTGVRMETDTIDFGSRGQTTLRELEACFDGTGLTLTLLNRVGTNDAWKEIGPFTFQEAGRLIRSFTQTELKIRLTFPTVASFTRFSYLKLWAQEGGRVVLADTLTLNNLL